MDLRRQRGRLWIVVSRTGMSPCLRRSLWLHHSSNVHSLPQSRNGRKACPLTPMTAWCLRRRTAQHHTPYVCVQPLGKHGGGEKAKGVWLVYSDKKLTDTVLDGLFVGLHAAGTVRQHWPYTFARLNPFVATSSSKTEAEENAVQQVQPVVLHPAGCINANAMESISSAMEISVIGGRNAAHLLLEQTDMV